MARLLVKIHKYITITGITALVSCSLGSDSGASGSVVINNTGLTSGCSLQARLDGGELVTLTINSPYTFPSVSDGSHTVTLSSTGTYMCGSNQKNCAINNGSYATCKVVVAGGSKTVVTGTANCVQGSSEQLSCP